MSLKTVSVPVTKLQDILCFNIIMYVKTCNGAGIIGSNVGRCNTGLLIIKILEYVAM
jgi:hypothetical protein